MPDETDQPLEGLVDQLEQIASTLGYLLVAQSKTTRLAANDADGPPKLVKELAAVERLTIAQAWLRAGQIRRSALGDRFAADPAWDMVLSIYIDGALSRKASVTKALAAAAVPPTTALRWATSLEAAGWLKRVPDQRDKRRSFLGLTEFGRSQVEAALDAVAASDRKLGLERIQFSH